MISRYILCRYGLARIPVEERVCSHCNEVEDESHVLMYCPLYDDIKNHIQSAYKANHSTETALLRVYNDMLFSIDQGGGGILVLLDLSSAFDTIDHAMLFNL